MNVNSQERLNCQNLLKLHHAELIQQGFRIDAALQDQQASQLSCRLLQGELLLDCSKNLANQQTWELLLQYAQAADVGQGISRMFGGEAINTTEQRPALHVALRSQSQQVVVDCLRKMESFSDSVRNGDWRGYKQDKISDIVNIGIGGSDLGPAMVVKALTPASPETPRCHFVSNVDPVHMEQTLVELNPATTLFIIASKSFNTIETLQNARAAKQWISSDPNFNDSDIAKHFVAVSTNLEAAAEFGIPADNLFPLWDWVGGRYSLWSAIGLPIALSIGMSSFRDLLNGGQMMDQHFANSSLGENLPVRMALLAYWYSEYWNAASHAVVPYSQKLELFPAFLQQLCMESLGKSVHSDGSDVCSNTGEIVWGTSGTNGQHSYFQLLHQGTRLVPVDFIAAAQASTVMSTAQSREQQQELLANCLSQSRALMTGQTNAGEPYRAVAGNRPSNVILLKKLNPFSLGQLIALYEHKVYVQSLLFDINAFDQWGVELGKQMSKTMKASLCGELDANLDRSSTALIGKIQEWQVE